MKPTSAVLKAAINTPKPEVVRYTFQDISSISHKDLPNNGFGKKNYYIPQTKFHHWPVYKKVQNTKITTEIKRIQGDLHKLRDDLLKFQPGLRITMNQTAGILNIKGDVVRDITSFLESETKK
ncbi:IMG2 [Candida oxycetoniae]|uniref:Large ribosomal subunit protein mL49 n=1 Tax=Candida oxycetoniae TaxID=497107 RepID=A0AAI9SZ98_9ASCO|nr:IMG2 [Candida oxycetoniae]KAI3405507.1 IMG2 [Candida oxycetoniae]